MHEQRNVASVLLKLVAVTLVLFGAPRDVHGQSIRGVLVDEHTGEPVSLGTVQLFSTGHESLAEVLTDQRGYFELRAPDSGEYLVYAQAFGYWAALVGPFELEDGVERVVEARVAARPMALDGLTVDAEARLPGLEAAGFYERRDRGRGDFITPQEIAASDAVYVQQLFHGRETTAVMPVPALEPMSARQLAARLRMRQPIQKGRVGGPDDFTYTGTNQATDQLRFEKLQRREPSATYFGPWGSMVAIRQPMGGYCTPWLYVDGLRIIPNPGEVLADVVPMTQVRAVEIYQAPFEGELPFKDISSCECGALVFWTSRSGI